MYRSLSDTYRRNFAEIVKGLKLLINFAETIMLKYNE